MFKDYQTKENRLKKGSNLNKWLLKWKLKNGKRHFERLLKELK